MIRCLSCGGTYQENDGTRPGYFHSCPAQFIVEHAVCDEKTGEVITPAKYGKTPNPRNENFRYNPDTKQLEMIAEGHGIEKVS